MRGFSAAIDWATHWRRMPLVLMLALLGMLTLSACGGGGGGEPAAATLIQQAKQAISKDTAYHFKMTVDHPGTGGSSSISITEAEGDVVPPDKIQGSAEVATGFGSLTVQFIGIGTQQWVQNPQNQQWTTPSSLGFDIGPLPNPSTIITMVLNDMQNPQGTGDDSVDSGDCWLLEGMVPAGDLAAITGGDPTSKTPIDTRVCVAKNADGQGLYQPYEFILKGIAAAGDTAQTTRTFQLSKFDEKVNFEPPPQ